MNSWTVLLIIHGLLAVALLGALSHQALSVWVRARRPAASFVARFRSVPGASYERHRRPVRADFGAGRNHLHRISDRSQDRGRATRPVVGPRCIRAERAFRRSRTGAAARVLVLLA